MTTPEGEGRLRRVTRGGAYLHPDVADEIERVNANKGDMTTPEGEERSCETCGDTGRIRDDHSEGAAGLPCPDCCAGSSLLDEARRELAECEEKLNASIAETVVARRGRDRLREALERISDGYRFDDLEARVLAHIARAALSNPERPSEEGES